MAESSRNKKPRAGRKRRRPLPREALFLYADSERDANMLYATRMFVPDPFVFFQIGRRKFAVMSDLEIDRARSQARVHQVLPLSAALTRAKASGIRKPGVADVVAVVLRERGVRRLVVPSNFPVGMAEALRRRRFAIRVKPDPFYESREIKSDKEVAWIRQSVRAAEAGMAAGIEALRRATIRNGRGLHLNGSRLTSERLKSIINSAIMKEGASPSHTIVAGGRQACDPHNEGSGPLRANETIVIDIFPRSERTGYFGDITRTVVRGRASERQRHLYETVRRAQRLGVQGVGPGADGQQIHRSILLFFEREGYRTGPRSSDGRMEGFFHGTGHGIGLDIHELPRIADVQYHLRRGNVVTVEPGLYYPEFGGVRIEDIVVVTSRGRRNLMRFPKFLEI